MMSHERSASTRRSPIFGRASVIRSPVCRCWWPAAKSKQPGVPNRDRTSGARPPLPPRASNQECGSRACSAVRRPVEARQIYAVLEVHRRIDRVHVRHGVERVTPERPRSRRPCPKLGSLPGATLSRGNHSPLVKNVLRLDREHRAPPARECRCSSDRHHRAGPTKIAPGQAGRLAIPGRAYGPYRRQPIPGPPAPPLATGRNPISLSGIDCSIAAAS